VAVVVAGSLLLDIYRIRRASGRLGLPFDRLGRLCDMLFGTVVVSFSIGAIAAASFIDGVTP
jgi:hypothetical protein